jgi:hypothetical protein
MWIHHAFKDYSACRCLLLNGLFAGFVLAEQAIEKMLKAYLYLRYPEGTKFVGKNGLTAQFLDVVPNHDLVALATLVERDFPAIHFELTSTHRPLLEELSYHFHMKYPDNQTPLRSATTETLFKIDTVMVKLSMNIPIEEKSRWRVGIFSAAWSQILSDQAISPDSIWVREKNLAYWSAFNEISSIVTKGYSLTYPERPL